MCLYSLLSSVVTLVCDIKKRNGHLDDIPKGLSDSHIPPLYDTEIHMNQSGLVGAASFQNFLPYLPFHILHFPLLWVGFILPTAFMAHISHSLLLFPPFPPFTPPPPPIILPCFLLKLCCSGVTLWCVLQSPSIYVGSAALVFLSIV